jgi:hypothetical protein
VQGDPIKPTLKSPGTKRLKLQYDGPLLSNSAFKATLRRYIEAEGVKLPSQPQDVDASADGALAAWPSLTASSTSTDVPEVC